MSALHHAAQKRHLPVANTLLDRGALLDIQGPKGLTPLYFTSWASHANIVVFLLQGQANLNARDVSQQTASHYGAIDCLLRVRMNHASPSRTVVAKIRSIELLVLGAPTRSICYSLTRQISMPKMVSVGSRFTSLPLVEIQQSWNS